MGALCESVDSSIRSSGSVNAHRLAADALERALEVILNRVAMCLALPTCKLRSVVGNDQFQASRHGLDLVITVHCSLPAIS
jgi:hypothetical protein